MTLQGQHLLEALGQRSCCPSHLGHCNLVSCQILAVGLPESTIIEVLVPPRKQKSGYLPSCCSTLTVRAPSSL